MAKRKSKSGSSKKRKVEDSDSSSESSGSSSEAESSDEAELSDSSVEKDEKKVKTTKKKKVDEEPDLSGLTELEREAILFERNEQERKRKEIEALKKAKKKQESARKKSVKEDSSEESEDELESSEDEKPKTKPKAKRAKVSKRAFDSDSEDDINVSDDESSVDDGRRTSGNRRHAYSDDEEDDEDDNKYGDPIELRKSADLKDFISMQMTRNVLVKWDQEPYFESCVRGFVRLLIGENKVTHQNVYRICEIVEIKRVKAYPVDDVLVEHELILKHGKSEGKWTMDRISNSPFLKDELIFFEKSIEDDRHSSFPTKRDVAKFTERIKRDVLDYKLSYEEIRKRIEKNKSRRTSPAANLSSEKVNLEFQIRVAKENDEPELVRELEIQLDEVLDALAKRKEIVSKTHAGLTNVNMRNIKENLGRVIEKKESEGGGESWNPFARKPTRPVVLWSTLAPGQSNDNIEVETQKSSTAKEATTKVAKPKPKPEVKRVIVNDIRAAHRSISLDVDITANSSASSKPKKQWNLNRPKPTGAKKMSLAEYMQKMQQQT